MKLAHDLPHEASEFIDRYNAWYVSERAVTGKDYVDGQAYLEWMVKFPAFGRWHKAFFVTKKIDPVLDYDLGLISTGNVPEAKIASACDSKNSPVFVDQVKLVEVNEGVCPSWIWFQVTNDLHCDIARFPNFVFKPLIKIDGVGSSGEGCVVRRSSVCHSASCYQVIKGSAKVVDSVPENDWQGYWQWFRERYVIPVLSRLEVHFLPNAVRVLTEIGKDEVVQLANVRLRALQLQKRA